MLEEEVNDSRWSFLIFSSTKKLLHEPLSPPTLSIYLNTTPPKKQPKSLFSLSNFYPFSCLCILNLCSFTLVRHQDNETKKTSKWWEIFELIIFISRL